MPNPKERKPDIEKFCLNCGRQIERKNFNGRIEDYSIYKRRKYCDHGCYTSMKKKTVKVKPAEPTKEEMAAKFAKYLADAQLIEDLTPLDFMLREMNRTTNSLSYRKEMAALAAPYVHPKLDAKSTKTKKEERQEAAGKVATGGKFTQTAPPGAKVVGRIG